MPIRKRRKTNQTTTSHSHIITFRLVDNIFLLKLDNITFSRQTVIIYR